MNRDQLRNPTLGSRVWATLLTDARGHFHAVIIAGQEALPATADEPRDAMSVEILSTAA